MGQHKFLKHFIENALDFAAEFIQLFTKQYVTLAFAIGVLLAGIAIVGLRDIFFDMMPWMSNHYKGVADAINVVYIIIEVIAAVIDAIIDVIVAIDRLFGGHMKYVHITFKTISATALHMWFKEVLYQCAPLDSLGKVVTLFFEMIFTPLVCPLLRVTYNLPASGGALHLLLGWASVDANPSVGGNNCRLIQEDWLCLGLDSGFIIEGILFPLLIFIIVIFNLGPPLFKLLYDATEIVIRGIIAIPKKIHALL